MNSSHLLPLYNLTVWNVVEKTRAAWIGGDRRGRRDVAVGSVDADVAAVAGRKVQRSRASNPTANVALNRLRIRWR